MSPSRHDSSIFNVTLVAWQFNIQWHDNSIFNVTVVAWKFNIQCHPHGMTVQYSMSPSWHDSSIFSDMTIQYSMSLSKYDSLRLCIYGFMELYKYFIIIIINIQCHPRDMTVQYSMSPSRHYSSKFVVNSRDKTVQYSVSLSKHDRSIFNVTLESWQFNIQCQIAITLTQSFSIEKQSRPSQQHQFYSSQADTFWVRRPFHQPSNKTNQAFGLTTYNRYNRFITDSKHTTNITDSD